MRSAALRAAEVAADAGVPVFFDLNLRTECFGWDPQQKAAFTAMEGFASHILGSEDEFKFLSGICDPEDAVDAIISPNTAVAVCRCGSKGAWARSRCGRHSVGVYPETAVDTTGAGDSFNGGHLAAFLRQLPLPDMLLWGTAAAAISVRGAGTCLADRRELRTLMAAQPKVTVEPT